MYVSGSLRFAKKYIQKEKLLDGSRTTAFIELMRKMSLCRRNEHIVLWMLRSMLSSLTRGVEHHVLQKRHDLKYELYLIFLNACTLGLLSVVECMYDMGACGDERGLEKACMYGYMDIVKKLLTLTNKKTDWKRLVQNASGSGNKKIVELLIKEMKKQKITCNYSLL